MSRSHLHTLLPRADSGVGWGTGSEGSQVKGSLGEGGKRRSPLCTSEPSRTPPRAPRDKHQGGRRRERSQGSWVIQGAGKVAPIARGGGAGSSGGRREGGSYPEAAELRAVGPGGGWNPSGSARLRAPSAAGSGSCCWRDRVGSPRPRSPGQSRRAAPRRSVSRGGGLGARGSFWAPCRLRRQPRWAPGASCPGVATGAQAAADPAIPQPATGAHLCRDKG